MSVKCCNEYCHNTLKQGDKVYHEGYYFNVFCSQKCLIEWSNIQYEWCIGIIEDIVGSEYVSLEEGLEYLHPDNK